MSKIEVLHTTLVDLPLTARKIIDHFSGERLFAISGKMGAGKTTLIKAFCEVLGVNDIVNSPTFALVNVYSDSEMNDIYHFDFYRIKKLEEVFDIGYEEYLYSGSYCFMEWPEMIKDLLPDHYVAVDIQVVEDEMREIRCKLAEH